MNRQLDSLNRRILALLAADGRRSFADIGEEVGLSASAIKRRVDSLQASGILLGFSIVVDPSAFGTAVEALCEISCAERTAPKDVLAVIEGMPEVVSAFTVSGKADAIVRLRVTSIAHLEDAIERLRQHPNVLRTDTTIVLSTLVDRPSLSAVVDDRGHGRPR